ncbi:MAG: metallophosphatase family protein, partial [bacterium]|nr:metallophosphatase family protein [bacterium]
MRLGLITDIHEEADRLRIALDRLAKEKVDKIVMIGDVVAMGEQLPETCALLKQSGAVGVWGNHDFALCQAPDAEMRQRFGDDVLAYMATLKPRLEIAGCSFTHVEPWL